MKVSEEDFVTVALALAEADAHITFMNELVNEKKREAFAEKTRGTIEFIKSEQLDAYGVYNVNDIIEDNGLEYEDLINEITG